MGKIEGWSRRQDLETGDMKRVWENDSNGEAVAVNGNSEIGYELLRYNSVQDLKNDEMSYVEIGFGGSDVYDRLDDAVSDAVWWLERNGGNLEVSLWYSAIESLGVDVTVTDYGNAKYVDGWKGALQSIGYTQPSEQELKEALAAEHGVEPEDIDLGDEAGRIQNDNTYNQNAMVWKDINYGVKDLEVVGKHLVSFKVHGGGDIRGSYGGNVFMWKDEMGMDRELMTLLNPELDISVYQGDEQVAHGTVDGMGYIEWHEQEMEMDDDQIMEDVVYEWDANQKRATLGA